MDLGHIFAGGREDRIDGEPGTAIGSGLRDRDMYVTAHLRRGLWGQRMCPERGAKSTQIEG